MSALLGLSSKPAGFPLEGRVMPELKDERDKEKRGLI